MKPILDATAGNRKMWDGRTPEIPYVVFMDRETKLRIPPDVFADHRAIPFRDDVFYCVVYDPPFMARRNPPQYWNDPRETKYLNKRGFQARNAWWGLPKTKKELISTIHKAQKEFQRITNILCLKWVEVDYSLWKILPFFKDWQENHRQGFKQMKRPDGVWGRLGASDDPYCKTWWFNLSIKGE